MLCCKLWIDVGFFLEWLFCFVLFFSYYGDRVCLALLDYFIIRHIIHQHHSVKSEQSCRAHCCCYVEISLKPLADMSSPLPREVNTGNGVVARRYSCSRTDSAVQKWSLWNPAGLWLTVLSHPTAKLKKGSLVLSEKEGSYSSNITHAFWRSATKEEKKIKSSPDSMSICTFFPARVLEGPRAPGGVNGDFTPSFLFPELYLTAAEQSVNITF